MVILISAPFAAALVNWRGLGLVAAFALVTGLVIVGAFSMGIVGLDRWSAARSPAQGRVVTRRAQAPSGSTVDITKAAEPVGVRSPEVAFASLAMSLVGFGICVLAVLAGLWSIVAK